MVRMKSKLLFKSILISFLIIVFTIGSTFNIQPVEAYTYTDLNIPNNRGVEEYASHPTYGYIVHQSGKIVYVSGASNDTLKIYILSSTGNLESYQNYDLGVTSPSSIVAVALIGTYDDFARCFVITSMTGAYSGQITSYWVNINVNTYSLTKSSGDIQSVADGLSEARVSPVYRYDNSLWVAFIAGDLTGVAGDAETKIGLAQLDLDTNLIDVTVSAKQSTPNFYSWIYGIQDTEYNGQFLYIAFGRNGYDTVHYAKWDLSAEVMTQYANQPTSNNRMVIGINTQFIGGGIVDEWDNGGSNNYTWLYYTWAWTSYSTVNYINIVHTRLCFNDTDEDLDTTKLLGLTETIIAVTTSLSAGLSSLSGGFHILGTYDNFYVIYPDLESGVLSTKITEWDFVGDWFNLANAEITMSDYFYNPNYSPYYLYNEYVGRNFSLSVQVNVYTASGRARIIYGLTVFEANYDVILSWVPNDEPFYSDTLYGFSGTTLRNTIGTQVTTLLYKDGVLTSSFLSGYNGDFSLTSWMFIGVFEWEFRLYSGGESVYNETFNFLSVYREGEGEGEDVVPSLILPTTVTLLFLGLVPLIMTILPAIILSRKLGIVGLIVGLGIGLGICASTGILPSYFLYLDILLMAIILVYFLKGND